MLPTAGGIPEEYRAALLVWLQHLPIPYDERCKIDISSIPIAQIMADIPPIDSVEGMAYRQAQARRLALRCDLQLHTC